MEKSEKAKKLREQRKYGKKVSFKTAARFSQSDVFGSWQTWFKISLQVQTQVIQNRQKQKKAMLTAVKKYQKGTFSHVYIIKAKCFHFISCIIIIIIQVKFYIPYSWSKFSLVLMSHRNDR